MSESNSGANVNGRAIAAMLVAMLFGIGSDTFAKLVSSDLPLGQIIVVRGLLSLFILLLFSRFSRFSFSFRPMADRFVLMRVVLNVASMVLYLSALFRMPIANATAILQVLPLAVTAAGAILLSAPVGWRRWTAIMIGFSGVLIIVRPGPEGFNLWAFAALAGVLCGALRDLVTRRIPVAVSSIGIYAASLLGGIVVGLVMGFAEDWVALDLTKAGVLIGAAVFSAAANVLLVFATRAGDISVVAPFRYSILVWAVIIGIFVWGEIPDALTLFGAAIIVATGIYSFLRERKVAREGSPAAAAAQAAPVR